MPESLADEASCDVGEAASPLEPDAADIRAWSMPALLTEEFVVAPGNALSIAMSLFAVLVASNAWKIADAEGAELLLAAVAWEVCVAPVALAVVALLADALALSVLAVELFEEFCESKKDCSHCESWSAVLETWEISM